jgi:DHA1 family inner membrane transport protein
VTGALLLFGVGLTIGNIAGGYLADWKLMPSLIGILIALISVLTLFSFTDHRFVPALLTVPVWGALAFALVPLLQTRVVDKASDAPNLASTLIQATFNLGNASGAWFGGDLILHGASYTALPWLGAFVALLALGLSGTSFWLERYAASTRRDDVLVGLVDGSRSQKPAQG